MSDKFFAEIEAILKKDHWQRSEIEACIAVASESIPMTAQQAAAELARKDAIEAKQDKLRRTLWETATAYHEARGHEYPVFDGCQYGPCKRAAAALAQPGEKG